MSDQISYHKYKKQGTNYKTKQNEKASQIQNISNFKIEMFDISKQLLKEKLLQAIKIAQEKHAHNKDTENTSDLMEV